MNNCKEVHCQSKIPLVKIKDYIMICFAAAYLLVIVREYLVGLNMDLDRSV